jgi:hypothetical protein
MSQNEDDSLFPQIDLMDNESSSEQQENVQPAVKAGNEEVVYVLPKTYNGKTVTELFPEFDYDSVHINFTQFNSALSNCGFLC